MEWFGDRCFQEPFPFLFYLFIFLIFMVAFNPLTPMLAKTDQITIG